LPSIAALLLRIVVAVFDTRLFHEAQGRPYVPRAVADAIKAREMVTRVVVLSSFSLALDALMEGPPAPAMALGTVTYELIGGALSAWRSAARWSGCASASTPPRLRSPSRSGRLTSLRLPLRGWAFLSSW
jgi:hypothetical protein